MTLHRPDMHGAPSISDVARLAGVSIGTVSNTLNSPQKVMESTRLKVQQAIDELGFVRNAAASSLAAGVSTTVGMVLVDLGNSLFVNMARGAEREAQRLGFSTFLADSDIDAERQNNSLRLFDEARVAGIILAPLEGPLGAMEPVKQRGRPIVLLNYSTDDNATCSVVVDEHRGGQLAAQHLIELGRRRLVFVGRPTRYRAIRERLRGAKEAADAAGIPLEVVETEDLNIRHGRAVGEALASRSSTVRPDGIVAGSDLLAVGCIQGLVSSGMRVPQDVAVVGYDNNYFASDSLIPVSTVAQPADDMGRIAMRLLAEETERDADHRHRTVTVAPSLIVRASTVPPSGV